MPGTSRPHMARPRFQEILSFSRSSRTYSPAWVFGSKPAKVAKLCRPLSVLDRPGRPTNDTLNGSIDRSGRALPGGLTRPLPTSKGLGPEFEPTQIP